MIEALIKEAEHLIEIYPQWSSTKFMRANYITLQLMMHLINELKKEGQDNIEQGGPGVFEPY